MARRTVMASGARHSAASRSAASSSGQNLRFVSPRQAVGTQVARTGGALGWVVSVLHVGRMCNTPGFEE